MTIFAYFAIICWLIFTAVWLTAARSAKRTMSGRWRGLWLRLIIAAVLYMLIAQTAIRGNLQYLVALQFPFTWQAFGLLLTALGIAIAIWARVHLGSNWGMPQTQKADADLITTGPYAYVRNPIYSGMLLAMLGTALIWPAAIIIFVAAAIYFIWSVFVEERIMLQTFPDSYPTYKSHTKRLIPFMY